MAALGAASDEAEEWVARIRAAAPPGDLDRWLAILEREVDAAIRHAKTSTNPSSEWVQDARERVYHAIAIGQRPDDFSSLWPEKTRA